MRVSDELDARITYPYFAAADGSVYRISSTNLLKKEKNMTFKDTLNQLVRLEKKGTVRCDLVNKRIVL